VTVAGWQRPKKGEKPRSEKPGERRSPKAASAAEASEAPAAVKHEPAD